MNKVKIVLFTALAVSVATLIVIQHRQAARLTSTNEELRHRIEMVNAERSELDAANERLRAEAVKAQTDLKELARLRGDVARLRRDLAAAARPGAKPGPSPSLVPATDPIQSRITPFTGTARASLQPGQTLVMGGWPTASGKRTLALLTPASAAEGQQGSVVISSVYVQVPEALLSGPGWEQFRNVTKDNSPSGVFAPDEAKQFLEALQKMEGVEVLSSPRVATGSGQQASISIGDNETGLHLTLLPEVAADGRTVDLSVTNSIGVSPDR